VAHELGHLLGAGPRNENQLAAEGEADYQVGPLLREFVSNAAPHLVMEPVSPELEKKIAEALAARKPNVDLTSVRIATAAYVALTDFTGGNIDLDRRDSSVVTDTLINTYPSLQSRWDSVVAGLLGLERPRSWSAPKDFTGTQEP
jgi:hypothetical protein